MQARSSLGTGLEVVANFEVGGILNLTILIEFKLLSFLTRKHKLGS